MGAIDIHFHGAFGIDLMSAEPSEMNELARKLGNAGVAAFCPTTLSVPFPELLAAVQRLGDWISSETHKGALPLGIHLEGPYIHPEACGAHPLESIRPLHFKELEQLWKASSHTLKILTVAPERLAPSDLKRLIDWARQRKVVLSLGHSKANEKQAHAAFDQGFTGVTHAWNAMSFHHRAPGTMGAALGRKDVTLELILDGVHVAPAVARLTRELHGNDRICYVSDCVPAAGLREGKWAAFGSLRVQFKNGACRLKGDHLAGGGLLLPEAFLRWIRQEANRSNCLSSEIFQKEITSLTLTPLRYLGLSHERVRLRKLRSVEWSLQPDASESRPFDSIDTVRPLF